MFKLFSKKTVPEVPNTSQASPTNFAEMVSESLEVSRIRLQDMAEISRKQADVSHKLLDTIAGSLDEIIKEYAKAREEATKLIQERPAASNNMEAMLQYQEVFGTAKGILIAYNILSKNFKDVL